MPSFKVFFFYQKITMIISISGNTITCSYSQLSGSRGCGSREIFHVPSHAPAARTSPTARTCPLALPPSTFLTPQACFSLDTSGELMYFLRSSNIGLHSYNLCPSSTLQRKKKNRTFSCGRRARCKCLITSRAARHNY